MLNDRPILTMCGVAVKTARQWDSVTGFSPFVPPRKIAAKIRYNFTKFRAHITLFVASKYDAAVSVDILLLIAGFCAGNK